MKVLDLLCSQGHGFEGWFASEEEFQAQLARSMVQCPICSDAAVRKALSAPRLNLRAARGEHAQAGGNGPAPVEGPETSRAGAAAESESGPALPRELQAAWLRMAREIVAHTADVGPRFANEARRMHYGEIEQRAIRGQASAREAQELLGEGISVLPLLLPAAADEPLQ